MKSNPKRYVLSEINFLMTLADVGGDLRDLPLRLEHSNYRPVSGAGRITNRQVQAVLVSRFIKRFSEQQVLLIG